MIENTKEVNLFPKKASILGLLLSIFLVILTISIISKMWNTLEEIDELHFPLTERSAINVRLVNQINYQFKLVFENQDRNIAQDLKMNFESLEQNYKSLDVRSKTSKESATKLFKDGREIIYLLTKEKLIEAKKLSISKDFQNQLSDFSLEIYDSTEALAENRDKNSQKILKTITQTVGVSLFTILFLMFLVRKVYIGYAENLRERLAAQDRANLLSKQRETLIHVLCHDLGNPVSAIYSLTEMGHLLNEEAKSNMLENIKENAKESLDIIDLTRKMQALEAGKFKVESTPIKFSNSLNKSLKTLNEKIKAKNITITEGHDKDLEVFAEETSLVNSILNNILTNSIKFSHEGGEIHISSIEKEDVNEVIITDYGIGIPEELLSNLFSETEQTSRLGTDGELGTGFGMPLVKKFMISYGGQIKVNSSTHGDNVGTTTTLSFPKKLI